MRSICICKLFRRKSKNVRKRYKSFYYFFSEISNFVAITEMKRRVNRIFNSLDIFKKYQCLLKTLFWCTQNINPIAISIKLENVRIEVSFEHIQTHKALL